MSTPEAHTPEAHNVIACELVACTLGQRERLELRVDVVGRFAALARSFDDLKAHIGRGLAPIMKRLAEGIAERGAA